MIVTINENDCGCGTCANLGNAEICSECAWDSKWQPKPLTNADSIRAMSDEELAKVLSCTILCVPEGRCRENPKTSCYECWINWLKQPAKEET